MPMILVQIEYATGSVVTKLYTKQQMALARRFWQSAKNDFSVYSASINWA